MFPEETPIPPFLHLPKVPSLLLQALRRFRRIPLLRNKPRSRLHHNSKRGLLRPYNTAFRLPTDNTAPRSRPNNTGCPVRPYKIREFLLLPQKPLFLAPLWLPPFPILPKVLQFSRVPTVPQTPPQHQKVYRKLLAPFHWYLQDYNKLRYRLRLNSNNSLLHPHMSERCSDRNKRDCRFRPNNKNCLLHPHMSERCSDRNKRDCLLHPNNKDCRSHPHNSRPPKRDVRHSRRKTGHSNIVRRLHPCNNIPRNLRQRNRKCLVRLQLRNNRRPHSLRCLDNYMFRRPPTEHTRFALRKLPRSRNPSCHHNRSRLPLRFAAYEKRFLPTLRQHERSIPTNPFENRGGQNETVVKRLLPKCLQDQKPHIHKRFHLRKTLHTPRFPQKHPKPFRRRKLLRHSLRNIDLPQYHTDPPVALRRIVHRHIDPTHTVLEHDLRKHIEARNPDPAVPVVHKMPLARLELRIRRPPKRQKRNLRIVSVPLRDMRLPDNRDSFRRNRHNLRTSSLRFLPRNRHKDLPIPKNRILLHTLWNTRCCNNRTSFRQHPAYEKYRKNKNPPAPYIPEAIRWLFLSFPLRLWLAALPEFLPDFPPKPSPKPTSVPLGACSANPRLRKTTCSEIEPSLPQRLSSVSTGFPPQIRPVGAAVLPVSKEFAPSFRTKPCFAIAPLLPQQPLPVPPKHPFAPTKTAPIRFRSRSFEIRQLPWQSFALEFRRRSVAIWQKPPTSRVPSFPDFAPKSWPMNPPEPSPAPLPI